MFTVRLLSLICLLSNFLIYPLEQEDLKRQLHLPIPNMSIHEELKCTFSKIWPFHASQNKNGS